MTKRIIDEEELLELLQDSATLCALASGGVDNWNWYEESLENLELPDEESLTNYPVYPEEPSDEKPSV